MGSGGLLLEDCKAKRFPNICKLACCEVFEQADGVLESPEQRWLEPPPHPPPPRRPHSGVRAEPVLQLSTRWRQQPFWAELPPPARPRLKSRLCFLIARERSDCEPKSETAFLRLVSTQGVCVRSVMCPVLDGSMRLVQS